MKCDSLEGFDESILNTDQYFRLNNPLDFDRNFKMSFTFVADKEHHGGLVSFGNSDASIEFAVDNSKSGLSFGAHIDDGSGNGPIVTYSSYKKLAGNTIKN